MLKLFAAGDDVEDDAEPVFEFALETLYEFRDLDANGEPAANEIVARLNLRSASAWNVTTNGTEDSAVVTLRTESPVALGGPLADRDVALPDRTAIVSLVFTIRADDATVDANGTPVAVPKTAVKYDLVVERWPWVDAATDRLALDARASGVLDPTEADGLAAATAAGVDGTPAGAVSWTTNASGTDRDGGVVDVPVRWSAVPDVERDDAADEERGNATSTRLTFVYDAPNLATLVHDPVVGIASANAEEAAPDVLEKIRGVPAVGGVLAVGAVAALAVALGRRR